MSASTWIDRARDCIEFQRPSDSSRAKARRWIGIDYMRGYGPRPTRKLVPLLVFALVAALGVSALRIDLIRTRYAMASALAEEKALIEEQRNLIVRRRQLRDPVELAVQARKRGFKPLSVTLSLPDPRTPNASIFPSRAALPSRAETPLASRSRSDWR